MDSKKNKLFLSEDEIENLVEDLDEKSEVSIGSDVQV
jgi:hypothetical protein